MDLPGTQVYGLIGEDGFARFVAALYRRVPGDDIVGPMYPPDDPAAAESRADRPNTPASACGR